MRWLAYLAGRRLVSLLAVAMGALIFSAPALAKPPPPPPDWIASYLNSVSVQVPHCSTPLLSQPFKNWKDMAYYTPAPGQSVAGFTGDDWLLLDGASVKPGTFDDGAGGHVLDLPSRSLAISPPTCGTADYPKAHTMT